MKKISSIFFAVLMSIGLIAACNDTTKPPEGDKNVKYNNIEDYADKQGYKGWEYYCGNVDEGLQYMTYSAFTGKYLDKTGEGYIQKDIWQPSASNEIMASLTATASGELKIFFELELISLQGTGSDGVAFYITTSQTTEYTHSVTLRGTTLSASDSFALSVKQGEKVYFIMSALSSIQNDLTRVEIKAEY